MSTSIGEQAIGLGGKLSDFGVAEILQLIGQQRKTGILEVKCRGGRCLSLCFDNGAVVSATPVVEREDQALCELLVRSGLVSRKRMEELTREAQAQMQSVRGLLLEHQLIDASKLEGVEALLTRETIFELLLCTEGDFSFSPKRALRAHAGVALLGAEQILMDGLRMLDEWNSVEGTLPDPAAVCRLVVDPAALFQTLGRIFAQDDGLREKAAGLLLLVDGKRSVRELVDCSLLGTFDGNLILVTLMREGVLTAHLGGESAGEVAATAPFHMSRDIAAGLLTLVPFALVLLLALAPPQSFFPKQDAENTQQMVLVPDRYAGLMVQLETLRAQRALEAAYWAGRPISIGNAQLVRKDAVAGLPADALVSSTGRPYYYVAQQGRVIPLAPERSVTLTH